MILVGLTEEQDLILPRSVLCVGEHGVPSSPVIHTHPSLNIPGLNLTSDFIVLLRCLLLSLVAHPLRLVDEQTELVGLHLVNVTGQVSQIL